MTSLHDGYTVVLKALAPERLMPAATRRHVGCPSWADMDRRRGGSEGKSMIRVKQLGSVVTYDPLQLQPQSRKQDPICGYSLIRRQSQLAKLRKLKPATTSMGLPALPPGFDQPVEQRPEVPDAGRSQVADESPGDHASGMPRLVESVATLNGGANMER